MLKRKTCKRGIIFSMKINVWSSANVVDKWECIWSTIRNPKLAKRIWITVVTCNLILYMNVVCLGKMQEMLLLKLSQCWARTISPEWMRNNRKKEKKTYTVRMQFVRNSDEQSPEKEWGFLSLMKCDYFLKNVSFNRKLHQTAHQNEWIKWTGDVHIHNGI